jgi:hypothetical protein
MPGLPQPAPEPTPPPPPRLSLVIILLLLLAGFADGQTSKTPIYNGILQSDLDANGFSILNLAGGGGGAGLPPMTGHNGEFLTNNGISTALWGPAYIVSITDPVDPTKQFQFDLSAFPTATTRQLSIAPGGNSTTVIPAPGGGNNVVKGITSAGVVTLGQLAFSNLSGFATTAQGGMLTGGLNGQVLAKSSGSDYALQWLNLTGGGNVSSVATPVNGQLAQWTGPTTIQGLSAVPTTAAGLPTLGTTGQVLSKIDGTSYNTQWVTLPGGGNVISVGTPSLNQIAQWTDSTHAQGIAAVPIAQGGTGAATAPAGTVFANNSNVTAAPAFVINPRITAISNLTTDGFVTTNSGIGTLAVDTTDYEPALGNPASNGYVLSSTTAGVRSWVAGGGGSTVSSVFTRTGAVVAATNDYTFAQIGSKPATLSGYGITDAQPLDADLTAIAGITGARGDVLYYGASGWAKLAAGTNGNQLTTHAAGADPTWDAPGSGGDVVGPAASVDSEVALFSGTTGKLLQRATGTGLAKLTSGVQSTVTAPTGAVVGDTDTQTLTNKEIAPRISSQASNATWSPNADTTDVFVLTLQAAAATTINNPSGTPVDGQKMIIRAKCDGTARALTWSGSQWRGSTDVALPSTLTASKTMYMGFIWNATDSRWDIVAKTDGF